MSKQKLRGVLLCEDEEHERFFRRLLERKWFGQGKLRVERIPNNQGAGDAWVLKQYAGEVQTARRLRSEKYALVVAVDGDNFKLKGRLRQLDQQLRDAGLATREAAERIVLFLPTRSVETWELWLCDDHEVDEDGDFKQRFRQAQARGEASGKLAAEAWSRDQSPEEEATEQKALPSLAAGRVEVGRLSG